MKFDRTRSMLVSELQEKKRCLIDLLSKSDRNFENQRKLFEEYVEFLQAVDILLDVELSEERKEKNATNTL